MGSNYLNREAAGTCLDTRQLQAVGFSCWIINLFTAPHPHRPLLLPWLLGKKSPCLYIFPSAPTLQESPTSRSRAALSPARGGLRVPGPLPPRRCAGGRPARRALPLAPRPALPWVPAAAGEGGGRPRVTDVLLWQLSVSAQWLPAIGSVQWTGNAAQYNNTHACQQQQLRVLAPRAGDAAAAAAATAAAARAAPAARLRSAAQPALIRAQLLAAWPAPPSPGSSRGANRPKAH